jgi:hypothetical protein
VAASGQFERIASLWRLVVAPRQSVEDRLHQRRHGQGVDERAAVGLDRPVDLGRIGQPGGRRLIPARVRRWWRDAPKPGQDADEPLGQVDLAESRHLLPELPLALLRPGRHEPIHLERPEAVDHGRGREFDHPMQGGPVDGDERVPEVERDRLQLSAPGDARHVAALDGQIARNGQYEQVVRSGVAV